VSKLSQYLRFLTIVFAVFFVAVPLKPAKSVSLTAAEQAWLREHQEPVRVHNEMNWKPFNFNEDGQPMGYSIDYMNLVAKKLGLKIEYVSGPNWNDFLGMMRDRTLDLMVNIASTKDRRKYLAFTQPYLITSTALYVRNAEHGITSLDDMAGRRIAFPKGFFFEEFIRRYYPKIKIVTFESSPASFRAVDQGLADAVMALPAVAITILNDNKLNSIKFVGKITNLNFITTFSIAARKDEPLLRDIIQKGMDAISPAEILTIRNRWNVGNIEFPLVAADDLVYLRQLGEMRLCVNPGRLPLEAINIDGSLSGISSEFMALMSKQFGIPARVVRTRNWVESLQFVREHKCDILPMAIQTAERDAYLGFTSPWLSVPYAVATRPDQIYISNIDQVIEHEFGVVRGSASKNALMKTYPNIKLVEVESVADGLNRVDSGKLFGVIDAVATLSRAIQSHEMTGVKISGEIGLKMNYAVGVRKDNNRLLSILDHAVSNIDEEQILGIYHRWLAVAYIDRVDYTRLWQVLGAIFLILIYLYTRYRQTVRMNGKLFAAHARIAAVNQDLDEKNRRLEELNQQKTKLFSIIAHDLKGPFTALLGFSQQLSTDARHLDHDGMERSASFIHQAATRAFDLLDNLLEWSRLNIKGIVFDPSPVDLSEIIRTNVELFRPMAENKGVSLEARDLAPLRVVADVNLVNIMIRNLLNNAVKFTNEGDGISIKVKRDGDWVEIEVRDTGVGMEQDKVARLFMLDEKISTLGTNGEPGTGLGLQLCKELTEKHGGNIHVASRIGEGSSFRVTLPRHHEHPQPD